MWQWKKSWLYKRIVAWIPQHMSNACVLGFFEVLRKLEKALHRQKSLHLVENAKVWADHKSQLEIHQGYIEDQKSYGDMKYGKVTMKYAGCEIFAVYNALVSLKAIKKLNLSRLIDDFEDDGMVLSGRFGTSPKALKDYFDSQGYATFLSNDIEDYDRIGKDHDALILTMYNDKDNIMNQVHTVHVSKQDDQFTAHNVKGDGSLCGPYSSVTDLIDHIHGGAAKAIALIGIKKVAE